MKKSFTIWSSSDRLRRNPRELVLVGKSRDLLEAETLP